MILTYASQGDYDAMTGKPGEKPAWSPQDFAAMGVFMESFSQHAAPTWRPRSGRPIPSSSATLTAVLRASTKTSSAASIARDNEQR